MIVAMAGGVDGAKLAAGLERAAGTRLKVVVNTGADFEHLGLKVCPDLDTMCYTLAGLVDRERGQGRRGDTWHFMHALADLGGPESRLLGDAELAMHVWRTDCLRSGQSLGEFTRGVCALFGIKAAVYPMSSEPEVLDLLADPALESVIFGPADPWQVLGPMLAIDGYRDAIAKADCPVIAVTPSAVGAAAPESTGAMMRDLGLEPALAVAQALREIARGIVIDVRDAHLADPIRQLGLKVKVCSTNVDSERDRARLAADVLDWARSWP